MAEVQQVQVELTDEDVRVDRTYTVRGAAQLTAKYDGRRFVPMWVRVSFRDGRYLSGMIAGPLVNKDGTLNDKVVCDSCISRREVLAHAPAIPAWFYPLINPERP